MSLKTQLKFFDSNFLVFNQYKAKHDSSLEIPYEELNVYMYYGFLILWNHYGVERQ